MVAVVKTVGVIGTGVIGASWTGLFLAHGLKVLVADPAPGAKATLDKHLSEIWPSLEKIGLKNGASLQNYEFVGKSLAGHYDKVDFLQENAPERPDLKIQLFAELDAQTRPDVVIASSSSGLPSSTFVGQCKQNKSRVLVGHPFNPPHLIPLVEIVPHPETSQQYIDQAMDFYRTLGRHPIHIKKEVPGHIANRLQLAVNNEAYSLVARGIVSSKDLDACITNSLGPRWAVTGPFMSNAMGGGGGVTGFKHLLEHLGPAARKWGADMEKEKFEYTESNIAKLAESVQVQLENSDVAALEAERDRLLVELLELKKSSAK